MGEPSGLHVRFGDFELDQSNARLSRRGQPIDLPPKAFELLCALARQPGQLIAKDALLDAVWGHRHVSESVLKTTISHLRQALDDDARQPLYVETVSRRGYRFISTAVPAAAPVAPSVVALQDPASDAAEPELVGRRAPLDTLRSSLAGALRRQRQLTLVAGEAGIGKSTLISRITAALPAQFVVATGQCVEHYGAAEPYMPVLEALNVLCRGARGESLIALMRRVAPTWLAQLPWFLDDDDRNTQQREVAGATQDRMLREFGELLDRYTAEQPLLLVLEDLHWSDHATAQLIGYLARRRSPAALMLLGSFRPADVIASAHPLNDLRHELRLHGLCNEIDLESFSEVDVADLLARRLDGACAPEPFVQALHAHTNGLPLFVVNVIEELIAQGQLQHGPDGWQFPATMEFSVPRSITGVVEKQLTRLPASQQALLAAASIAGVEFLHVPLAAVMQLPEEDVQRELDELVAKQYWISGSGVSALSDGRIAARYAFRHTLYRQVLLLRLSPAQSMQLHRRTAEALSVAYGARIDEIAAELATHLELGGEPVRAAHTLTRVAARALGRSSAAEALRSVRYGLQLIDSEPGTHLQVKLDLHLIEALALARLHVVSHPEVAAAFELARESCASVGDTPSRARVLHGLWWVNFARGDLPRARDIADELLDLAQQHSDMGLKLAGHSALGLTLSMTGDLEGAKGHLQIAIAVYEEIGDRLPPGMFVQDPGVEARSYLSVICWGQGEPVRARALSLEAVALAERIRHPTSLMIAQILSSSLHLLAGEYEQARAATARVFDIIEQYGLPRVPGPFAWMHGRALATLGGPGGIEQMREAERQCSAVGMRTGLTGYYMHLAEAYRTVGLDDEAIAAVDAGLTLGSTCGEHFMSSAMHRIRAELLFKRGEREKAAADLRAAIDVAVQQQAGFHAINAWVTASTFSEFPGTEVRQHLQALLQTWDGEDCEPIARARGLLAALADPNLA